VLLEVILLKYPPIGQKKRPAGMDKWRLVNHMPLVFQYHYHCHRAIAKLPVFIRRNGDHVPVV
jgi:hypothetical protein